MTVGKGDNEGGDNQQGQVAGTGDGEAGQAAPALDTDKFFQDLDARFNQQNQELDAKLSQISPKKEQDSYEDGADDPEQDDLDDEFLTKKSVKQILKSATKEISNSVKKDLQTEQGRQRQKEQRDVEAFKRFPQLNPDSPHYDKTFVSAVQQEIQARKSRGRSAEDVDLLYDSAASVKATNPKWMNIDMASAQDEQRRYNNQQGSFTVRRNSSGSDATPNARQSELAKSWGVDEKYLKRSISKQR